MYSFRKIISIPIFVTLIFLVSSASYLTINVLNAQSNLKNQTQSNTDHFALDISILIESQIKLIDQLMLFQWISVSNDSMLYNYDRFIEIATSFSNFSESILAINYINSNGVIQWVFPYDRNMDAVGKNVTYYMSGQINDAYMLAKTQNKTGLTPIVNFFQGGSGIVAYIPIIYNYTLIGFFNVVLEITSILMNNYLYPQFTESNSFMVEDSNTIFFYSDNNFTMTDKFVVKSIITYYNHSLQLYAIPSNTSIQKVSFNSYLHIYLFILLVSIMIYYLLKQLIKKTKQLEKEFDERVRVEKIITQNKKLNSLGNLAGGIAHDFNNLLMGISANISIIEYNCKKQNITDMEIENSVRSIKETITTSKDLTSSILQFTRKSNKQLEIINVTESIKRSIDLIHQISNRKLKISFIGNGNYEILGNYTDMLQILMNILMNAIDAINIDTGSIIVSLNKIPIHISNKLISNIETEFEVEISEFSVQIIISDDGVGMTKTQLDQLYDIFYTTKDIGKGTGLGMFIVHKLVTKMYGSIEGKSEIDKGTEISLNFPIVLYNNINKNSNKNLEINTDKKSSIDGKILIVDDEITVRSAVAIMLEKNGIEMDACENGLEALKKYSADKYSILILDINMPVMNGIELYYAIQEINKKQKILFFTGYSKSDLPGRNNPYVEEIEKPFTMEELITKLSNLSKL